MSQKTTALPSSLLVAIIMLSAQMAAQQVADTLFKASVGLPAHKEGKGPTVLVDEGHHNFHTMEGRYLGFARLLQNDGYILKPHRGCFTRAALSGAQILVFSTALAKENEDGWNFPTPSAFDSTEIATVRDWVADGGSLLLIPRDSKTEET